MGAIKRPLYCIAYNGSRVPHDHCDSDDKPEHKQPCEHHGCHATWRVSNWTKVRASQQFFSPSEWPAEFKSVSVQGTILLAVL